MRKRQKTNPYKRRRNQHSKGRAFERYGLSLNRFDIKDIIIAIRSQRAVFIKRHSNRITEWTVEIKNTTVRVLYDRIHECIATVLPVQKPQLVEKTIVEQVRSSPGGKYFPPWAPWPGGKEESFAKNSPRDN